jgi:hypothetical protein
LFYRGTDSQIHEAEIQPGVGPTFSTPGVQAATGEPTAVIEANGYRDVYFVDGGSIMAWFQGSGGWSLGNLGAGGGLV